MIKYSKPESKFGFVFFFFSLYVMSNVRFLLWAFCARIRLQVRPNSVLAMNGTHLRSFFGQRTPRLWIWCLPRSGFFLSHPWQLPVGTAGCLPPRHQPLLQSWSSSPLLSQEPPANSRSLLNRHQLQLD